MVTQRWRHGIDRSCCCTTLTFILFYCQHGKSINYFVMCQGGIQRNTHNVLQNKINVETGMRGFLIEQWGVKETTAKTSKNKSFKEQNKTL